MRLGNGGTTGGYSALSGQSGAALSATSLTNLSSGDLLSAKFTGTVGGAADAATDEQLELGQRLFIEQCSSCHVSANGDNNAWMAQVLTLGTNFVAKAVGAMYNGATCVVARHTSTGENRAYCLKGNTITNTFNLPTVSDLNWDIVGTGYYHAGPLNNKDILWQNKSTGQGRLWYLDGSFGGSTTVNTSYGSTSLQLQGPR